MSSDLTALPLYALSEGLVARRFSPVDVVEASLARIAALEPKLQAFVHVHEGEARQAAQVADKAIRAGNSMGPLHGIPIALKDLVEFKDHATAGGCAVWRDRMSKHTATLAQKLQAAGMIVLGKTHTVEFAYGAWGTNQHMGTPWNPWDMTIHRTPGGSSSGSAVAVAARMAPCAIGTDTGGSVRIPAAWCGITGLKTTIGRISTYGVLPLSPTLDTPGPIARSVEDCAILLVAMEGNDPLDPLTAALPPSAPMTSLRRGVKELRLARLPDGERAEFDAEVLAAYDRSLKELAAMGAQIVDLPIVDSGVVSGGGKTLRESGDLVGKIISAECYPHLAELVDDDTLPLDEAVRIRVRAGASISSRQYREILAERERAKQQFAARIEGIDAVLTPSAMTPAIPVASVDQSTTPALSTRWVNFLDLCALALPNGMTHDSLPTSLQIVCRGGDEAMALRIGWALENATDWHKMAPLGLDAVKS
jgi:aspartyl-tRNA(Asn)/glutamyl-tRNA(Gln) amidotransferase subunit A